MIELMYGTMKPFIYQVLNKITVNSFKTFINYLLTEKMV